MVNPYQPPNIERPIAAGTSDDSPTGRTYGGLARAHYFVITVLDLLVGPLLELIDPARSAGDLIELPLTVVLIIIMLVATAFRCVNIGISPWWAIGFLIPFLNLFILGRCLVGQMGHAEQQKLDRPGRIGLVVYCVFVIVLLVSSIL